MSNNTPENRPAVDLEELKDRVSRAPLHRFLQLKVLELEAGRARLLLPFRTEILANETYIHGGVIATLIDVTGDWAVATLGGQPVPTVDMRVDYLRVARNGEDLTAVGEVIRQGKNLAVADVAVYNPHGQLVAIGRALYRTG